MGLHPPAIDAHGKHVPPRTSGGRRSPPAARTPRGHFPVYVGEGPKRFVVPISYLKQPLFRGLLDMAEEEFGLDQPEGGLRLPCSERAFTCVLSQIAD